MVAAMEKAGAEGEGKVGADGDAAVETEKAGADGDAAVETGTGR